jgi:predicted dehydrogenase
MNIPTSLECFENNPGIIMRFALVGNHPDGLAFARALCVTGRHELTVVQANEPPEFAPNARAHHDLEEVLATSDVKTVIVAGAISIRGEQLRRALQSEHDVICVHPCSEKPDSAYEAALIRDDTGRRLLPLLPEGLHPAIRLVRDIVSDEKNGFRTADAPFRLLQWEAWTKNTVEPEQFDLGWSALRQIGGEIVEVSGLAAAVEIQNKLPLAATGVFESGGLFQATLLPNAYEDRLRLTVHGDFAVAILDGPAPDGSATLRWRGLGTDWKEKSWAAMDRWQSLIGIVEAKDDESSELSWRDEIRCLELADGLRRSVEKRRTSGLEYQEISEEVGSKGTLTLIGCAMIWLMLLVFMLSVWIPWVRWAIVPMIAGFLVLVGINRLGRNKPE